MTGQVLLAAAGRVTLMGAAGKHSRNGKPRAAFWGAKEALSRKVSASGRPGRKVHTASQVVAKAARGFGQLFKRAEQPAQSSGRRKLVPGTVSPPLEVPKHIPRPPYAESGESPPWVNRPQIHDKRGIERMRAACKLAAEVRDYAGTLCKPGVTTDEIDKAVHKAITDAGAYPSPLNYGKFPKSVCTSINECVCHGIPDSTELQDGDIINIDVTVYLNGYHGDTSKTFFVGNVSDDARQLVEVTKEALDKSIAICAPGVAYNLIGKTIHDYADQFKYGVVKNYVGHGVGRTFHSGPAIMHYRNNAGGRMLPWQTFTIEPMLTQSGSIKEKVWSDNWTVVTADHGLSAQFEHTILITDEGHEILTL
eukprot:jgi/Chlat1/1648/Chrsp127S01894